MALSLIRLGAAERALIKAIREPYHLPGCPGDSVTGTYPVSDGRIYKIGYKKALVSGPWTMIIQGPDTRAFIR